MAICTNCGSETQGDEDLCEGCRPTTFSCEDVEKWTSPSGIEFILAPPGTFIMGHDEGEGAVKHEVTITKPFYIGVYCVKQSEWMRVMGNNPSDIQDENRPVENVDYADCLAFIEKLNALEGVDKYRLPTEAEWEYASRAGNCENFCFGSKEDVLTEYGWFAKNSGDMTHPVGELKPNAWGIYDMHGNVEEWCCDWFEPSTGDAAVDPKGPSTGHDRVVRGGCWVSNARCCGSGWRNSDKPEEKGIFLGFRLARDL